MSNYSKLNMLNKRDEVFEAETPLQFLVEWVKKLGGKGTLYIHLPKNSKDSALQICRTVRKLSKKGFDLSSLVSYQVNEMLKSQELNPNLYALKRNLKKIQDTPTIERHYTGENADLKRVKVKLPKNVIYEIEFLLESMYEELGAHSFSVEILLELTLLDLLKELALGRSQNVIQTILESLSVTKDEIKEYEQEKGEVIV